MAAFLQGRDPRLPGTGLSAPIVVIGTIFQDSDTSLRNTFIDIMKPIALSFFDQICLATPNLKQNELFLRLQLSLGAFHQGFRIMFHPNHR